jgi:hypothetical protein
MGNVRYLPDFKALLLQYFKQEELDKYPGLFAVQKK